MVEPSAKKKAVEFLKKKYSKGFKVCCSVLNISRASLYYKSKLDDSEVIKRLKELAESHPNRGFDTYYARIRREGSKWSRSRVLRVYRELGLVRRQKRRRKLPEAERKPLLVPKELNSVWSMDFMSDSLVDGRTLRVLNIIDDHNRESLLIEGAISFPSRRVIQGLEQLKEEVGLPKYIRTDNGPEFISKEYKDWCSKNNVRCVYSEPGKLMQNGFVERFNRTFREDILDAYLFASLGQFHHTAEKWQEDYNKYHPHKTLKKMSPREYAPRPSKPFGLAQKALKEVSI
ncbi:putative transposase [Spirosomataceae bacterium TFI 002]|nr:putative transposase [Spirosomataceae bacterium TFI 002]